MTNNINIEKKVKDVYNKLPSSATHLDLWCELYKQAQEELLQNWNKELFHDGFIDEVTLRKKDFEDKLKEIREKEE